MKGSFLGLKAVLLAVLMTMQTGCNMEMESASVSLELDLGFLKTRAEATLRARESQQGFVGIARAIANDGRIELTAANARIPNQTTLVTVGVKAPNGSLVAANTFAANVMSGRGMFNNPGQVENWLNSIAIPSSGSVFIEAPDIEIIPPSQGSYSATSKLVVANQVVASATGYAYVPPGGGINPPEFPKQATIAD